MLTTLLTCLALLGPSIHVENVPYKDAIYAQVGDLIPGGGLDLFVMRANGDTLLVEFDELRFGGESLQAVLYLDDSPTVYRTKFVDGEGDEHWVVTNCANFGGSLEKCAEHHKRSVDIMKKLFPKADGGDRDVDLDRVESRRIDRWL